MNGSATTRAVTRILATGLAAALAGGLVTIGVVTPAGASLTSTLHVATIAGNGTEGTSGNAGPAYAALLNDPTAVAVDNFSGTPDHGDIAVANSGSSYSIRVIAGTTGTQFGQTMVAGDIYTISSGLGSTGLAFDRTGNLVLVNPGADAIERIAVTGGGITTDVIGVPFTSPGAPVTVPTTGATPTSAKIQPIGVAVDPTTGNILFTDLDGAGGSPGVRYLAETSGTYFGQTVTAGKVYTLTAALPGYGALTGIAVDPVSGNVVFAAGNVATGQVVELDAQVTGTYYGTSATAFTPVVIAGTPGSTNATNTVLGAGQDAVAATSATLDTPKGLFVDGGQNVLIADSGDHAVRVVAFATTPGTLYGVSTGTVVTGDIYTVAGNGSAGPPTQYAAATTSAFGTVTGVAVPSGGEPVFTDASHHELDELGTPAAPSEAPPGPSATGESGGSAYVTWQPVPAPFEGFTAPTHYTVAWYTCIAVGSCTATAAGTTTVNAPSTSTTVQHLTAGQLYSFTVTGANGTGTSPVSSPAYATASASAPGPVTNLTASAASGQVTATWTPPANNGGSTVTGYTATLSPCSTTCTQTLGTATTTATFTGLTNGDTYSVSVAASNTAGTGPSSSVSAKPTGTPGVPTITRATPGNGQVTLTWSAPASNGGSPITGYVVNVATGVTPPSTVPTGSTGTSFTVTGLTNGTPYTFSVAAVNGNGTGTLSPAVTATPVSAPSAPTNVTATSTATGTKVHVTWTDPAANGTTISGYTLSATPVGGGTPVTATVAGTTATSGTITGLAMGTTYNVTVAATYTLGTGPASAPAQVTTTDVPGAPTGLAAAANTDGSVTLTWSAPATHGTPVTDYHVQLNSGSGATGFPIDTGSSATTTTIPAIDLTAGNAYTFTVTATNAAGTGPASSPSNSVTSTTAPGKPGTPTGTANPDGTVTLTWTAAATHGATITSYTVTPTPGCPSCTGLTVTGHPAGTSTTIGGLTPGDAYTFTVTATSSAGSGPASTASTTVTPFTTPSAPTNVTATSTATGTKVHVTWTDPAANGTTISGYTLSATPVGGGTPVTATVAGT
ncbi:MAG: beta strand repeat-containing protein, partial [Acidimicrobiales bacterium]